MVEYHLGGTKEDETQNPNRAIMLREQNIERVHAWGKGLRPMATKA